MSDTVNVPGLGQKKKKGLVVAGAFITMGIVGYAYYRHRSTAGSTAAAATAADPNAAPAYDPNAIDPNTGLTYAAEGGTQGGVYGYGANPYAPVTTSIPIQTQQFATNGQWAQAAEDYLVQNAGSDPNTVAAALGKYITGQRLTSDQQTIVSMAIGFEQYPPVPGPNGYPPSMSVAAATPAPTPAPPPKTTAEMHAPSGFRSTEHGTTTASFIWSPVTGAAHYQISYGRPVPGGLSHYAVFSGTSATIGNLPRRTTYAYAVRAVRSSQPVNGAWSTQIHVTTR
jgi:hypothetical protein